MKWSSGRYCWVEGIFELNVSNSLSHNCHWACPWMGGKEFWGHLLVTRGDKTVSPDLTVTSSLNSYCFGRSEMMRIKMDISSWLWICLTRDCWNLLSQLSEGLPNNTPLFDSARKQISNSSVGNGRKQGKHRHLGAHEFQHDPWSSGASFPFFPWSNWSQCHWDAPKPTLFSGQHLSIQNPRRVIYTYW